MSRVYSLISFATALSLIQAFGQEDSSASLFGLDNVIDVHITIKPEEWAKLQPPKGTKMDFGVAIEGLMADAMTGGHFRSEKSTRPGLAGYLGVDHQYGKAEITIDGETVKGIGLRYKGNGTFLEYVEGDVTRRLSFKIDFNEYDDELEFRALTKVNLNNNITDPSLMREPLSYELFREAGIYCSRVGYARVSLTISGKVDRQPHGLYTVVEQVDKRFLKDRYGSAKGLLMKPSTFGAFRYFGEEWDEYEVGFVPKTKPSEEQKQRVIEFARLIHKSKDDVFEEKVESYLDVDQFLRFLAVNVLLTNLDSFLGGNQNHYIYLEPESNKFQFFPWDMDISFGVFPFNGTPETRRKLSIDHPGGKGHTLIERVLNIQNHKQTYYDYLDTYLKTIFAEEKMHQQIEKVGKFVRPMVKINGAKATDGFDGVLAERPKWYEEHPLKYFVTERRVSVRRQLDGESEGHILFDKPPNWPEIIGWGIAILSVLLLNFSGWLWGVVAGFRGSILWGFLNMLFYPLTPVIYGFGVRKELGRRSAMWALFCTLCCVALIVTAIAMGGE
ncbi:MAG: CotH kinase family protein [Verrucomicrobiota bacterium]|nr:CotH kinase family protein [Verrucomicrobiota bacterium]